MHQFICNAVLLQYAHTNHIHTNSRLCNNNRFNMYQYFTPINCRVSTVDLFEFYVHVCTSAGKQHQIQTTAEKFMNEIFKSTLLFVYAYFPAYSVSLSLSLSFFLPVHVYNVTFVYIRTRQTIYPLYLTPPICICAKVVCVHVYRLYADGNRFIWRYRFLLPYGWCCRRLFAVFASQKSPKRSDVCLCVYCMKRPSYQKTYGGN